MLRFFNLVFLVTLFGFVSCATQSLDKISEETLSDADYFKRDHYLSVTKVINSKDSRESLKLNSIITEKVISDEAITPERSYASDNSFLEGLGIISESGSCACDGAKICPGKGIPAKRARSIASSIRILAPINQSHNRFYYIRSCDDTPEKVAEFIWGDASKAQDLVHQIGGISKWHAGRRFTYLSPLHPKDKQMKSFYNDHPPIKKSYKIKKGDSLASIAHKVYGDARSWREIALRNGIATSDRVAVGKKLILEYKE